MHVVESEKSDTARWLEAHGDELVAIASRSGIPTELIHLVAVLVLARLSNSEIRAQLWAVEMHFHAHQPAVAVGLTKALRAIRALVKRFPM